MTHTRARYTQKQTITEVLDPDSVTANTPSTRAPDTLATIPELLPPDPNSNQLVLIELHNQAITAFILDVATGRVRLGSVQAADDVSAVGAMLLEVLRNARASK